MVAVAFASIKTAWSLFYFGPIGVLAGYLASLLTSLPQPQRVHGLVLGDEAIGEHQLSVSSCLGRHPGYRALALTFPVELRRLAYTTVPI